MTVISWYCEHAEFQEASILTRQKISQGIKAGPTVEDIQIAALCVWRCRIVVGFTSESINRKKQQPRGT